MNTGYIEQNRQVLSMFVITEFLELILSVESSGCGLSDVNFSSDINVDGWNIGFNVDGTNIDSIFKLQ